mgnify:CR=1 FL=1
MLPSTSSIGSNIMAINAEKYKNAVLYLLQQLGGEVHGKKKLAKLLYFADFAFFQKHEKSITGDEYAALPMGPFPRKMSEIVGALGDEGRLTSEKRAEWAGYVPTEVYIATQAPDISSLTSDEIAELDHVATKYGKLTGKELENLSHAEAPWIGTPQGETIAYELAFYREAEAT